MVFYLASLLVVKVLVSEPLLYLYGSSKEFLLLDLLAMAMSKIIILTIMNYLAGGSSKFKVQHLPIYNSRTLCINWLIGANVGLYALYQLVPGGYGLALRHSFTVGNESEWKSLLLSPFFHTSFTQLLFNCGILYTVGNYHHLAFGMRHFWGLFLAGSVAGAALTAWAVQKDPS